MNPLTQLIQTKNHQFGLKIPLGYKSTSMKNDKILINSPRIENKNKAKMFAVINVDFETKTTSLSTADNEIGAIKLMLNVGEVPFSEIRMLSEPTFEGIQGLNKITTESAKFDQASIDSILDLCKNHLLELSMKEMGDYLGQNSSKKIHTEFNRPNQSEITSINEGFENTVKMSQINISQRSELHLQYDGGKKNNEGKIKLFGLRFPDEKNPGRDLYAQYDEILTENRVNDELNGQEKESTIAFLKSEKGGGLPDIVCAQTLREIESMATKRPERINLSRKKEEETGFIIYKIPNDNGIFESKNDLIEDNKEELTNIKEEPLILEQEDFPVYPEKEEKINLTNVTSIDTKDKFLGERLEFQMMIDEGKGLISRINPDDLNQINTFVNNTKNHPQDALIDLYFIAIDDNTDIEFNIAPESVQSVFDAFSEAKTPKLTDLVQLMHAKSKKKKLLREFKAYSGEAPEKVIEYANARIEQRESEIEEALNTGFLGKKEMSYEAIEKAEKVNKFQIELVSNSKSALEKASESIKKIDSSKGYESESSLTA